MESGLQLPQKLEVSASGSIPGHSADFERGLAALQRSAGLDLDLSGSDEEEVDLPETDVHLREEA